MIAAEHDEAAAEVLDVGAHHFHLLLGERRGRDVREHDEFIILQVGEVLGQATRRADVELNPFFVERVGQLLAGPGVAVDHQYPWLARGVDQARGRVCCPATDP